MHFIIQGIVFVNVGISSRVKLIKVSLFSILKQGLCFDSLSARVKLKQILNTSRDL